MIDWEDTVLDGRQRIELWNNYKSEHPNPEIANIEDFAYIQKLLKAQAKLSFNAGGKNEKAKVAGIFKDANDLKELETLIREYLDELP